MENIVKAAVSFDPAQADVDIARIQFEQSKQRLIQATAARRIAELDTELQGVILGMREYGAAILAKERAAQNSARQAPDDAGNPLSLKPPNQMPAIWVGTGLPDPANESSEGDE